MPQGPEEFSSAQPNVLIVADESSLQGLISAFLAIMGCECEMLLSIQELPVLDLKTFDAVLVDGAISWAEEAIARLRKALPEKIIVLGGPVANARFGDSAQRSEIRHLSEELWPQQLWPTLQEILADSGNSLGPDLQVAQLVFDSFSFPAISGLRGMQARGRQLAYRHHGTAIDVLIEPKQESGRVSLTGQVIDAGKSREENSGLAVVLVDGAKPLVRTTTNSHGEFSLDFELVDGMSLEIRLCKGVWVSIPLGKLGWIRTRLSAAHPTDVVEEKTPSPGPMLGSQAKKRGNGE